MTQAMMRVIEKKGIVKVPEEYVQREKFTTSSQLEDDDDLVATCLAKLQDGIKVTPLEATDALKQYRKFQNEMGRLQTLISRPSVILFHFHMNNVFSDNKAYVDLFINNPCFLKGTNFKMKNLLYFLLLFLFLKFHIVVFRMHVKYNSNLINVLQFCIMFCVIKKG
jgi:hypothetical protein